MTKRHDRASAAFEVGYERVSQSTVSTSASSLTADAGHQSASGRRLRNGQRLTTAQIILSGWSANRKLSRNGFEEIGALTMVNSITLPRSRLLACKRRDGCMIGVLEVKKGDFG
jgi:hypothetical protein